MHSRLAIIALSLLPRIAPAQQTSALPPESDRRQVQLQAATANGMAALRDQILHTRVNRDFLVNDYLKNTHGLEELNSVLQSAQPVGGARWVDDHTCQVQMELPGPQVAKFLMAIARDQSRHSPIRPDTMQQKLAGWDHVKFSVVSSSAGGESIENARPHNSGGKWSEVTDSVRRSAIDAAHADAARHIIEGIGPIHLSDKTTVAEAIALPHVSARINTWLAGQPVTKISFQDDLKVSVTVSVSPQSLMGQIRSEVESDKQFKADQTFDWQRAMHEMGPHPVMVSGSANADLTTVATSLPAIEIPIQPPDWVDIKLEAQASAVGHDSRLKLGRAAEAEAVGLIRNKLLLLHISADLTLGDAAKSDPQIQQAIDRAMLHAHESQVDYRTDGSVLVRVSLDLQDAWDELRSSP